MDFLKWFFCMHLHDYVVSLIFPIWFPVFNFIDLFIFLNLDLICFPTFLRWKLFYWFCHSSFLIYAFNPVSFLLNTAFTAYHKFWLVVLFIFTQLNFFFKFSLEIYSLTYILFRSMLSNLHVFWDLLNIFLISRLIPLCPAKQTLFTIIFF